MRGAALVLLLALASTARPTLAQEFAAHIGSFRSEADAAKAWTGIKSAHAGLLGGREAWFEPVSLPGRGDWVRIVIDGFGDAAAAVKFCAGLKAAGVACNALSPQARRAVTRATPRPSTA
ncbi:MAG: SPOR domain-containing protein, partial [Alphaproteobacteria bacterium]|nr:SPOR domain-containing protein [Alphaproteobacteria bacterium]